jgi:serine phosphatase RsbU (regulator of sigma subunit)
MQAIDTKSNGTFTPSATEASSIDQQSEKIFQARFQDNVRRVDRLFAYLMIGQWMFGLLLAVFFSPYGWTAYGGIGKRQHTEWAIEINTFNLQLAIFLGGVISSLPVALAFLRPGWIVTRYVIACAQMMWSALLIHLTGGRIETHFHVFGSLAFLAFYRDWKPLIPATIIVAADHFIRGLLWPESVYGILFPEWWRFLEHAFWVAFEDVFLVIACIGAIHEMRVHAHQQAHIELTERLQKEMEIAARIQTSILPREVDLPNMEVAARMIPATEVGGDYYDLVSVDGVSWVAIGDVAGHGLTAGLVMLQAQSAIGALIRQNPSSMPRDILNQANSLLYENLRTRLDQDEFMTMSLLCHHGDDRVVFAGAHEEFILCRASNGQCERLPTTGTWLGVKRDVAAFMQETEVRLQQGDLLILYTDGITEARNGAREQFGPDRLAREVEQVRDQPVDQIRDHLFATVGRWMSKQEDDMTLLVLRYTGSHVGRDVVPAGVA